MLGFTPSELECTRFVSISDCDAECLDCEGMSDHCTKCGVGFYSDGAGSCVRK